MILSVYGPTDRSEVERIINSIKTNTPGHDDL